MSYLQMRNQLLNAPVELALTNNVEITNDIKGTGPFTSKKKEKPVKEKLKFVWTKGDLMYQYRTFPAADFSQFSHHSSLEVFKMFWDENIISYNYRRN